MRRTLQMTFLLCITLVPWQLYAQDVDDMLDEAADGLFAGKSPQQAPAPKTRAIACVCLIKSALTSLEN